jgi:histidine triad (HIT) family protein
MSTLFKKIIDGEISADIVHEDDNCLAFKDIAPQAPIHILIIPKKEIPMLSDAAEEDQKLLGILLVTANKIAKKLRIEDNFRLVINNGAKAGQSVFHLHLHLLSGRPFSWPPG